MVRTYNQSNNETAYKTDFICDGIDDIPKLPTNCDPGSTALVPNGSTLSVYFLTPSKTWAGPY